MKKLKYLKILLVSFLMMLSVLFLAHQTTVKADVDPSVFQDGVSNWKQSGSTYSATAQNSQIDITNNLGLGYGFGAAQTTAGIVGGAGVNDSDFLKLPLTLNGSSYTSNYFSGSRMNVFLNNNSNYISTVYQGKSSNQSDMNHQSGWTSPDFLITPTGYSGKMSQKDFSILGYPTSTNGSSNVGLENKTYWIGTYHNHPAYRILGQFTRKASSATGNQAYTLDVELLLRVSPTNSAIVQRELYLYNPNTTTQDFQVYFGEDTALGTTSGTNDQVPVRSIGDGSGLYISNTLNPTNATKKLYITNQTVDGFTDFTGLNNSNGVNDNNSNNPNWLWRFNNGGGQKDTAANTNLIATSSNSDATGDTGYLLKWPSTSLGAKEVAHFGSTMGVTINPYALPVPDKSYTNETRSDGTNQVGDKLKFTLTMANQGTGSSFNYNNLIDSLPDGLQIDPNSFKQITTDASGNSTTTTIAASDAYDSAKKEVNFSPGIQLSDSQKSSLTFEATITNDASGKTLTNTGLFYGYDPQAHDSNQEYQASVDIPVKNSNFGYTFTKLVKKDTDPDSAYSDSVKASANDTVDYKISYNVLSGSDYIRSLADGSTLTDDLQSGIELIPGSVEYTSPDGSHNITAGSSLNDLNLGKITPGQTGTITFKAKVDQNVAGTINNSATIKNAKTDTGTTLGDMTSSIAVINVQDSESLTAVPDIDFGSVNMAGQQKTLHNVATKGSLTVAHPSTSSYSINVAYDNTNEKTQMKSGSDTLTNDNIAADGSGLLYIRQRTNSADNVGTFVPILPTGTPIQTDLFTGGSSSVDLSSYVGVGDWQIKLGAGTKAGAYKGTLSWTMTDSVN